MTNQATVQSPDLVPDQSISAQAEPASGSPPISVLLITPDPHQYPYTMELGSLQTGVFKTVKSIQVTIDRGEDYYSATWRDIDEFGYGDTAAEALHDLCRSLKALYQSLRQDEFRLGKDLNHVWARLQEHFVPTHEGA